MTHGLEYRRLSQLFRETESEFCRFNRIPEAERRSQRRAVCALMFLDERLPLREPALPVSGSQGLGLIVDFESAALTREDVIYLRRCGVLSTGRSRVEPLPDTALLDRWELIDHISRGE